MKYSIIVPCYNEEKNIEKLVEEFKNNLIDKGYDIELILVNNGSNDNSKTVMEKLKNINSFIRIQTVEINKGYGYGILKGLEIADGDYLGWIHADLQFNPNEIVKAIEYLKQNNYPKDVFIRGKRTKRPMSDKFFTFGMSLYETLKLHMKLYDINAQPTIIPREFFNKWKNPPYDFSLDLYAYYMAKKENMKVYRYKVIQHKREEGKSSWNNGISCRIKLIKRVMNYSTQLKRN